MPPSVVAKASANPVQGNLPLVVQFSSAGTTGPTGVTLYYDWDFDDGTNIHNTPNPKHTYQKSGVYIAVLYVYDGSGKPPATASVTIGAGVPLPAPRLAPGGGAASPDPLPPLTNPLPTPRAEQNVDTT